MFSITPTTRTKLRRAMSAARWATFCAASAGVVTITMSARGSRRARPIWTSPVPGRHVDQQVVELAPVDVAEELLDGLGQHQSPPHQRGVLLDEEAGGHDLQPAGADGELVGDDQRAVAAGDPFGLHALAHPEQAGDREAPDVGVEHADGAALAGEGDGQVDGDRALAHAALAAGDGEDPGGRRAPGCRRRSGGRSSAP